MIEVHPSSRDTPLPVSPTVEFRLQEGETRAYTPERRRVVSVHVLEGLVYACGAEVASGSVARIRDEGVIALYAAAPSHVVLFDCPD
jgi:hypothetical protein